MATPRVGALGVGTTKGDLYVVNEDENLERVPVGGDGEVLTADSGDALGVAWANVSTLAKASFQCDGTDAVFQKIDLGGGAIDNPGTEIQGTHMTLKFDPDVLQGIPWQKFMPTLYTDTPAADLDVSIYWVSDGIDTGDCIWGVALERDNSGFDIDADGFAAITTGTDAGPGVIGELVQTTITVTGAALDGILKGEPLRLFAQRDGAAGGDMLTDNAELVRVVAEEV